jgi:hypothetical protein
VGALFPVGLLMTGCVQADAGASSSGHSVGLGRPAFWSAGAPTCGGVSLLCWEFPLHVRDAGDLRVAIDHATIGDVFAGELFAPDGDSVGTFSPQRGLYSAELPVEDAAAGGWKVRVTAAGDVQDRRFRMRAAVQRPAAVPRTRVLLPPNLQALPPHDLSFRFPVTNGSTDGAPRGYLSPGGLVSCHREETVEERAVRCLRMAFGVSNTGQGPMALFLGPGTEPQDRPLSQRLFSSDGSSVERRAGRATYHETHGHYHHADAIGLELLRVTDPQRGALEPIGAPHRKGFAHRDELLRDWTRFYPVDQKRGFGLKPGWGDYYEWDRPGNYVDFGVSGDGHYVLRLTADPVNGIIESNDRDNVSYTYIQVTGTAVRMLESGRGRDPWDRCKILIPFGAEAELQQGLRQPRRPRDCPPDTV